MLNPEPLHRVEEPVTDISKAENTYLQRTKAFPSILGTFGRASHLLQQNQSALKMAKTHLGHTHCLGRRAVLHRGRWGVGGPELTPAGRILPTVGRRAASCPRSPGEPAGLPGMELQHLSSLALRNSSRRAAHTRSTATSPHHRHHSLLGKTSEVPQETSQGKAGAATEPAAHNSKSSCQTRAPPERRALAETCSAGASFQCGVTAAAPSQTADTEHLQEQQLARC